jgi:hypothetical protein
VDVKEFHAMEAYLSLDLTKVKYNMRSLPTDEKEKKSYSTDSAPIEYENTSVKRKFSFKNNSKIFNSICVNCEIHKVYIQKNITRSYNKGNYSGYVLTLSIMWTSHILSQCHLK